MKKVIYLLIAAFVLCSVTGCGLKTYSEVSYDDVHKMVDDKESFILFIGATTCTHCDAFKVTLNKVIKDYNVDVKYIDIDNLEDEELGYIQARFPFSGTPTTVFVKDGEETNTYNRIEGAAKYSEVVDAFKENGYIKE